VGNQLATEHSAGQKAHTDVFIAAAAQIVPILDRDLFQSVNVKEYLPERGAYAWSGATFRQ
jgi:hypothetical protein